MMTETPSSGATSFTQSAEFAVVVVPGFSYLSLGCVLGPLEFVSEAFPNLDLKVSVYAGGPLSSDTLGGIQLKTGRDISSLRQQVMGLGRPSTVFVCCGMDISQQFREPIRWLMRDCKRFGVRILGLGAANWIMAETNLLPTGKGAVHWSSIDAFSEYNQEFIATNKLFVSDGNITSCAGELATLDLTIDFLRQKFGSYVVKRVCDQLLISYPRGSSSVQPGSPENRLRYAPIILRSMVKMMRTTMEEGISIHKIADAHGISQRQVERIFQKHLQCSPVKYLRKMQLEKAYQLCEQTEMNLSEISLACGFNSPVLMSRLFKREFNATPSQFRQQLSS